MNDTNHTGDTGDERRQRQMDFILEQQAQFSVDIQLLKETIIAHTEAMIEQRKDFNAHVEQTATEFARANERTNRLEQLLYVSLEGQEDLRQQVKLTNTAVDRLVETVAFILEERKHNGNGS
ncbi:MAG: hypothetical protein MSG64_06080 [Pyrinomonadaceae bacterium MAG19_C2-C3]|nr:hypothetical protein [Pyrinomonadaceae bacterium MAG19_C2-C3]